MKNSQKAIALGMRLKKCSNVTTLGVKANFSAYSPEEKRLIMSAPVVYYPSSLYAELFDTLGRKTFPSHHSYRYAQDKIKQTALFKLLNIPHPKTQVFYGKKQQRSISQLFPFPFIAKIPRGSAMGKGVFLIEDINDLKHYLSLTHVAYIQQYLPIDKDIRVVVIGGKAVHSYWRVATEGNYKTNIAEGGTISFDMIPEKAIDLAEKTAKLCKWDDVGIDIIIHNNDCYILEGNFSYGLEGFKKAGINYTLLMEQLIANNTI